MDAKETTGREFVPGIALAEAFFREAVEPIMDEQVHGLRYSAALIGPGSEVLGFDDAMSTDHHWGPRVMFFLRPDDLQEREREISEMLSHALPPTFRGYPTSWSTPDPTDGGVQHLKPTGDRPVNHRVEFFSIDAFFDQYLGIDPTALLSAADWLTLPHQKLRSVCAGRVFRDDLNLESVRAALSWYPHDLWLYVLAASWSRIGQEEHLMGRAGMVGDEIGSSVIAARLVREIMRLGFLTERVYPPYPKWFGRAFAQLPCAQSLQPHLREVIAAGSWRQRDAPLAAAYRTLARMHNALGITDSVPTEPSSFYGRPFSVIYGERVAEVLVSAVRDPLVATIARERLIGNIDLVSDNTDLLEDVSARAAVKRLYDVEPSP